MKILFTNDVTAERLGDVENADIVVIPFFRLTLGGNNTHYYVYKNKATGIKGTFSPHEFSNLIEEALRDQ